MTHHALPDTATHFADACEPVRGGPGSDVITSDSKAEWLAQRRLMLTASDMAAILGEDQYRDAFTVYLEKVTGIPQDDPTPEDPRFWGSELEQPILSAYARHHGWEYQKGGVLLRSRKHPTIGATLDAEINRGNGWEVNECKMTQWPIGWNEDEGSLPVHILIQAQTQLLVTGAPCDLVFGLLQGARPCRVDVEPNVDFFAVLIEHAEQFMELVRRMDPPPPTYRATETLKRMFPHDTGAVVDLPADAVEWTRELREVEAQLAALDDRREAIRNMIKFSMGAATYGVMPQDVNGKSVWKWKTQEKASYIVAASSSRPLVAVKEVPGAAKERKLRAAPVVRQITVGSPDGLSAFEQFRASRNAGQ